MLEKTHISVHKVEFQTKKRRKIWIVGPIERKDGMRGKIVRVEEEHKKKGQLCTY